MKNETPKKRTLIGRVISDKMQKTAVVAVTRWRKDPKYLKYYKITTKFKAHNEGNEYKTGEEVTIEASRPLSREKRWTIIGRIEVPKTETSPEVAA